MNLISTPRLGVIIHLAKDPMKACYQRELSRVWRVSVGGTSQILRRLVAIEMVTQEKRGRMYFYRFNLRNPVAKQFKILLNVDGVHDLVVGMAKNARRIVLSGSSAEGTGVQGSDIELSVLTSEKEPVRRRISDFNKKSDRRVLPIVVDANELVKLRREDKPLHDRIGRGIVLWEKE